jgi:hypothetical protein
MILNLTKNDGVSYSVTNELVTFNYNNISKFLFYFLGFVLFLKQGTCYVILGSNSSFHLPQSHEWIISLAWLLAS